MLFQEPLSPDLSPNATRSDILFSLVAFCNPLRWFTWMRGNAIVQLEDWFKREYSVAFAKSFDQGRTALRSILEALDLQEGDEVVLQAFTCAVVPNSILAARGKPIYVDIDETYNIDVKALERKLSSSHRIKAVIVQHTFGTPADIERIAELCRMHHVFLVEDCAHSIGADVKGKLVGTFGDAALFSFGRDKVVSSVSGGMAITNSPEIGEGINRIWKGISYPSYTWVAKRLLHPTILAVSKKMYFVASVGKVIILVSKWLNILPLVLEPSEKFGKQLRSRRLPNILALWAHRQLSLLQENIVHRKVAANVYTSELERVRQISLPKIQNNTNSIFLRYTIEVVDPHALLSESKKHGILLGNWYSTVIAPADCSLDALQYHIGSCPNAERASSHVVNLPTHANTSTKDTKKITSFIKTFYQS